MECSIVQERYYFINLIKNKTKSYLKYITNLSVFSNNGSSLYLHSEYYINDIKFRLIVSIMIKNIKERNYYFNLILCINSKQIKIKGNILNELNLCNSILELRDNYKKIIDYKKELSNHILINIQYDRLYINHIDSIILLKKIKLINYLNLPDEILDIIRLILFHSMRR